MATKRSTLLRVMMVFDLIILMAAFAVATWSVYQFSGTASVISFDSFLSYRVKISNLLLLLAVLYGWHVILESRGLYRSRRLVTVLSDTRDISIATLIGAIVVLLAGLIFEISLVNLTFLSIFWLTSTAVLVASRLILRTLLRRIRLAGRNLRHVVVVGTNSMAREYVDMIKSMPEMGFRFIGFVDDNSSDPKANDGLTMVANYNEFEEFMRANVIDEIVVFSPLRSQYDKIARIVELAELQGIILRFGIDPFTLKIGHSVVDQIGDVAVSTVQTGGMYGQPALSAKTLLDFLVSAFTLLLLSPLMIAVAVLIKWQSPGPALFVQQRLGLNKRRFNIYKFRTMREDAEQLQSELEQLNEIDGAAFKIKDDPRITSLGKKLRKTSIDELPQLFNVLKGDMSLVGPRPLPVRDFEGFEQDIHRRRFSVKPGITCLWQISGRSNISFDKWMELDMTYIDHWSIWLDLKILLKTIPAVLTRSGAE
jgi:exopolysaccharide biosynthesis polyprenyl glycosylphosphotransferase